MGDKGNSVRGYAAYIGCSTGKAYEFKKMVLDVCADMDKPAHFKVENLFQVVEGVAA